MQVVKKLMLAASMLMLAGAAHAQTPETKKSFLYSNRFSIVAGLIQPIVLKGGNVELTYYSKRMSFDYSHGFLLNMTGSAVTGAAKDQKLAYHLPYSTGFGVGYRITSFLDIRIEPKVHGWDVYYDGESRKKSDLIKSYKTYSLGLGVYYRYMPFKKKDNWLQGITTSTSIRWWPTIGSSLKNNKFTYYNKHSDQDETLKASNIGIAGTSFLFNISIGYTFGGK